MIGPKNERHGAEDLAVVVAPMKERLALFRELLTQRGVRRLLPWNRTLEIPGYLGSTREN